MMNEREPTSRTTGGLSGKSKKQRDDVGLARSHLGRFARKVPLEQLSRFCGNLAMCLSAGMTVLIALRTCHRTSPHPKLKEIMQAATERVEAGMELSDAIEPWRNHFPAFFLPVLRCGELSGRMDMALGYLEQHCHLLIAPARTVRNTWFVPLCIMLFGSAFCVAAHLVFAPLSATFGYVIQTVKFYGTVAAAVLATMYVPELKALVDRLRLVIPLLGPAERELAINRFFHTMNLLYSTGGQRVEQMMRWAAESSGNVALRADFLRAATVIESGGTISAAFSTIASLPREYKATIATGEEAGKLDAAFDTVCRLSADSVHHHLSAFQQIFFRVVAAAVILSVMGTFFSLTSMRR
jgi:type IV pilus assembly protein PilC